MRAWVLAIYLFSESLFFGTKSLVFGDADHSSYFAYFNMFTALLIVTLLIINGSKRLRNRDTRVSVSAAVIVSLISCLFMGLGLSLLKYNFSTFAVQQMSYFLAFTVPAVMLGVMITEQDLLKLFSKVKYINVYLSICFLFALGNSLGGNTSMFHDLGGASHLTIGYTMSALFAYNAICFMNRPKLIAKLFYLALMIFNVSIILFSGSRGALVSIVAMLLVIVSTYVVKRKKFIQAILLSIVSFIAIPLINANQNFSFAIQRIIAGFSIAGDRSTDERKVLYDIAFDNISNHPIFGNGIGSFSEKVGKYYYPHNLFLEVLNDFGILGILIAFITLTFLLKKSLWLLKQSYQQHIIAFLFINVTVQLMFSGSYLVSSQFWVIAVILFMVKRKRHQSVNSNIPSKPNLIAQ